MTLLAVGIACVALVGLLLELRKGRVAFQATMETVMAALKERRKSIDPFEFEALRAKVKTFDKTYDEWTADVASMLEQVRSERSRVEKTIERALKRVQKGGDGLSAVEGLAEEFGVEHGDGSEEGGMPSMREQVGMDVAETRPATALKRQQIAASKGLRIS